MRVNCYAACALMTVILNNQQVACMQKGALIRTAYEGDENVEVVHGLDSQTEDNLDSAKQEMPRRGSRDLTQNQDEPVSMKSKKSKKSKSGKSKSSESSHDEHTKAGNKTSAAKEVPAAAQNKCPEERKEKVIAQNSSLQLGVKTGVVAISLAVGLTVAFV